MTVTAETISIFPSRPTAKTIPADTGGTITHEIVAQACSNGPQSLPPCLQCVYENYEAANRHDPVLSDAIEWRLLRRRQLGVDAQTRWDREQEQKVFEKISVFDPGEQERAARLFPLQTDEDASTIPEGFSENVVRVITDRRREPGGYLLERAVFEGKKP
ncbi:hypothetical protein [Xylophilus sp. GOD-11R]|uniref:hypothetical protein n=1 Tax=Xylophilus sp. GOD-11R TaxID=3089814 RepID=UPI00298C3223|nr:hypothetical protein [Xylophilus sp. GOD-11R]WPB55569.1 hypothetical protein R9X41_15635 [Xylophilus sp. GOD-11R]